MKSEPDGLRVNGDPVRDPKAVFRSRPAVTLALLGLGVLAASRIPSLSKWNPLGPPVLSRPGDGTPMLAPVETVGEAEIESETRQRPDLAQPEHVVMPVAPHGPIAEARDDSRPEVNVEKPPVSIVDPTGSLDAFYAALARTASKEPGAITRIIHHGDSLVASDYVTATLRRKLQAEFGDAGHGFTLLANAWPAYFHNDVFREATSGWLTSRVVGPFAADGFYGLGGVSFRAGPNVRSRVGTAEKGTFGRNVSRFLLSYFEEPGGGTAELRIDDGAPRLLDTRGPEPKSKVLELRVPDGPHRLEILTKSGSVRAFGVALERDVPGVVLDAIGIQGASIRFLDKQDDVHWAEQLRSRSPSLVVFEFGANENVDGVTYKIEDFRRTMAEVLRQAKRAVPEAGCLVIAAMDRARKVEDTIVTHPVIPSIVREQEGAARDAGCAFWNTFQAMGGAGSMARWVHRGLGQADLVHPSGAGADVIGTWIYRALLQGYAERSKRDKP